MIILFLIFFAQQPENSSASGGNRCDKRSRQTQMVIIVKNMIPQTLACTGSVTQKCWSRTGPTCFTSVLSSDMSQPYLAL